ncbi:MAG TPA: recombinase family protein [Anaerolineae bacterium]|nr:recombinase family protein [Anaerolineae bacterium]
MPGSGSGSMTTPKEVKGMKPVAIYARVSTRRQEQEGTIESQIAALQEYAAQHGYQVRPEWQFTDQGVSGNVLNRPGLNRLRTAALGQTFRYLLVLDIDRLARDLRLQMLLLAEFQEQGLEVIFLSSPPPGADTAG